MPIVQLMVLGLIISAFAVFMIVLLSVSLYVSISTKEAAPATAVTPARRPDKAPIARETPAPTPTETRRYG